MYKNIKLLKNKIKKHILENRLLFLLNIEFDFNITIHIEYNAYNTYCISVMNGKLYISYPTQKYFPYWKLLRIHNSKLNSFLRNL